MFTNRYIYIYASVMVIIVAAILSSAALLLKPFQDQNIRIEKMKNILSSVNIEATSENAEAMYNKHIIEERTIDVNGEVTGVFKEGSQVSGEFRAFNVNMTIELKALEKLKAKESTVSPTLPMFVCERDNELFYIIPVMGKGLWGPIWGNIALKSDLNELAGATFAHKAETPGLGSEIDTKEFQAQFAQKKIFNDKNEFVSIVTVKGGVANSKTNPLHGVDAISGGTITSDALSDMLLNCLSNYEIYIKKEIEKQLLEAAPTDTNLWYNNQDTLSKNNSIL